jgi:hypothetical protein
MLNQFAKKRELSRERLMLILRQEPNYVIVHSYLSAEVCRSRSCSSSSRFRDTPAQDPRKRFSMLGVSIFAVGSRIKDSIKLAGWVTRSFILQIP